MTLLEALNGPRVLVMDAAMGTALLAAGVRSVNAAPLTHPELVRSIHAAHVAAGAEVVLTRTFQTNLAGLTREGLRGQRFDLRRSAEALARSAVARFVLGDFGPLYPQEGSAETANDHLIGDALFLHWALDGFLFETWSSPAGLEAVRFAAHHHFTGNGPPTLLSLAYHRDTSGALVTHSGHSPEHFAREARRHGVSALGVNCGRDIGLRDVIEILRRYREVTDLPLFARPNAGAPGPDGSYPLTPEMLAEAVPEIVAAGARMIGGCCGTTAAHVAAIAGALRQSPVPGSSERACEHS